MRPIFFAFASSRKWKPGRNVSELQDDDALFQLEKAGEKMKTQITVSQNELEQATSILYLPDGSRYQPIRDSSTCIREERNKQKTVVTGALPTHGSETGVPAEIIRDAKDPQRLMFLRWEGGGATAVHSIESAERIFVPPDPTSRFFPQLSLPSGLAPCGEPAELLDGIASTISQFVKLRPEQLRIVTSFVLASWFVDCFEAAPYLWVVGPLGSAKTKLVKLLWCFCRRGLIAGDLRSGSLYRLMDAWGPTLIVDEFEPGRSGASAELLRMLRTGSVPGVPAFRNGQGFSTYGLKIIASRQPLDDAALTSRGVVVNLLPAEDPMRPLGEESRQQIATEYQAKLLTFRSQNYVAVKNFYMLSDNLQGVSARTKQIARALTAPLLGDSAITTELLAILRDYDNDVRIERFLEPEWLAVEAIFDACHEGMENERTISEILVGGVAVHVNARLEFRGEDLRLGAKKIGLVLRSLGLRTTRLGRLGRGLRLTCVVQRKVHEIARQLGIDRRTIATLPGLENGYGGAPCALCEEFGVTGGLKFVGIKKFRQQAPRPLQPGPLFDRALDDQKNQSFVIQREDKVG